MIKANCAVLGFFLLLNSGCASVHLVADSGRREVLPEETDVSISKYKGPHVVYWNPLFIRNRLVVTLARTDGAPSEFSEFASVAKAMGYHVINLDYPNGRLKMICEGSSDPHCVRHYREEVLTGNPVSAIASTDQENSIVGRLFVLIQYLAARDSHWGIFIKEGKIDWSQVTIVGHAQGASEAAYVAKTYLVERAILIGGPLDYHQGHMALWLKKKSATPCSHFRALLHEKDPFGMELQKKSLAELCGGLMQKQVIVSSKPTRRPHLDLISSSYRSEWMQLLDPEL